MNPLRNYHGGKYHPSAYPSLRETERDPTPEHSEAARQAIARVQLASRSKRAYTPRSFAVRR